MIKKVKKMKFGMEEILLINAFEKISKVNVKDCILNQGTITYLVNGDDLGKAIGKKASNVKELEKRLKKKIEIIGLFKDPVQTVQKTFDIKIEENKIKNKNLIIKLDALNKKKLFNKSNRLKKVKELMKRNYDLTMIVN
jgi:NusA-like KH domain protein